MFADFMQKTTRDVLRIKVRTRGSGDGRSRPSRGVCRQIYARVERGAIAIFDVEDNNALHQILNEWADIVPAHFDTYPLIDIEAAKRMLAAQAAARGQ
jgi:muconolactone delta-isomerase